MVDQGNEIVGHGTLADGSHVPITRKEADAIWARAEQEKADRALDMPTEADALRAMHSAFTRLKELGWKEAEYCPKDGTPFHIIEPGSSGVHHCTYDGDWPTGHYWVHDAGDLWPSRPCLFKAIQTEGT